MAELRSAIFIDQLQPQTMCYLGTWIRGRLPRMRHGGGGDRGGARARHRAADRRRGQAHPAAGRGSSSSSASSATWSSTTARPSAVRSASAAVLEALGASPAEATKPEILASTLVSRLDHQHAFLINRNKLGSMALPGESLFVLEMQPASYAILAVNEAEKAARDQGRRLPHDRRHRPRLHDRRGVRRARGVGRGDRARWRRSHERATTPAQILRELLAEALAGTNGNGARPAGPAAAGGRRAAAVDVDAPPAAPR